MYKFNRNNELQKRVIALLTDFGLRGSHYVASMKAIILKINPSIKIIDLSHSITKFSIIEASYLIKSTYRYFPEGSVFICVVDPGVGSKRKILVIKTKNKYYFVGPDNGIFPNALEDNIMECYIVENEKYFHKPVSKTFHGRDIMAPVGAYISNNVSLNNFGSSIDKNDLIKIPILNEISSKTGVMKCTVQYIDNFGNITTTIKIHDNNQIQTMDPGLNLFLNKNQNLLLQVNNKTYKGQYVSHFADVPINTLLFMKGSTGYLEISLNQKNAAKKLNIASGDIIKIQLS